MTVPVLDGSKDYHRRKMVESNHSRFYFAKGNQVKFVKFKEYRNVSRKTGEENADSIK